mmetsp:Transcript_5650/g.21383  ORF Transcript_5650/g.21383 Transcript_5650/m.21383 type:complete len:278 (+) Transcript_5650:525-1358(+)
MSSGRRADGPWRRGWRAAKSRLDVLQTSRGSSAELPRHRWRAARGRWPARRRAWRPWRSGGRPKKRPGARAPCSSRSSCDGSKLLPRSVCRSPVSSSGSLARVPQRLPRPRSLSRSGSDRRRRASSQRRGFANLSALRRSWLRRRPMPLAAVWSIGRSSRRRRHLPSEEADTPKRRQAWPKSCGRPSYRSARRAPAWPTSCATRRNVLGLRGATHSSSSNRPPRASRRQCRKPRPPCCGSGRPRRRRKRAWSRRGPRTPRCANVLSPASFSCAASSA